MEVSDSADAADLVAADAAADVADAAAANLSRRYDTNINNSF